MPSLDKIPKYICIAAYILEITYTIGVFICGGTFIVAQN